MVEHMEMALDDIIKANDKTPRDGEGAGRKFNVTGKPRGGHGRNGAGGGFRNGRAGGVLRGRTRGGISKAENYTRGNVNSAWKHDKFNDFRERKIQKDTMPSLTTVATMLLVSNLDFGVSDSDMQELFSEIGTLKSAAVLYDRSGRSLGIAEIVFEREADALKAMEQYNGVLLDGRDMNIQLASSEVSTYRTEERSRIGCGSSGGGGGAMKRNMNRGDANRSQGGGEPRGNARHRGGGGRGGAGGAGRGKRPMLTAEQLDAELDAYVKEIKRNIRNDKCSAKDNK